MDNVAIYKQLQDTIRKIELEINSDETKLAEMNKSAVNLDPDMSAIAIQINEAKTFDELDKIEKVLDAKISEFKSEYGNLLMELGLDIGTV